MKKIKPRAIIVGAISVPTILFIGFFGLCVPLNVKSGRMWALLIFTSFAAVLAGRALCGIKDFGFVTYTKSTGSKGRNKKVTKFNFNFKPYIIPAVFLCIIVLITVFGSTLFNAEKYSEILSVSDEDFMKDLSESVGTDSIALMDTASAQMLGDREIGSLSNVVSQFNVSEDYTQIDFKGKPIKVSALEYAGYFKWTNNKDTGVCGYVTVDPVSMSASYKDCEGMRYVPSAYFFENAKRHIWLKYPTVMFGNLHFEIDEDGNPYYIASVYEKTISLFGGKTVTGCIILNPITGEVQKLALEDIPNWVDVVFDGDLICMQYNWHGTLQNGYMNSLIGKKGCKQVTTYVSDGNEDNAPVSDYGYVAKDGDIWIYTGITSVNGDSSNIGFLLANERTGESHYYSVAGADEKSAMSAAEGEVQEKGYQASFPSLINVSGNPTYIMVLKDSGGLVKLYAAVNVEQYNLVATASTQADCLKKYKEIIGVKETDEKTDDTQNVEITVSQIRYIDIDGNTYIYIISDDEKIYKAKAVSHEEMLLIKEGDKIKIEHKNSVIKSCQKVS